MISLLNSSQEPIDLKSLSTRAVNIRIPSPSWDIDAEQVQGGYGVIPIEKRLLPREIEVNLMCSGMDYNDVLLIRDEVYKSLAMEESIYLIESRLPGKRWNVHFQGVHTPEHIGSHTFLLPVTFMAPLGLSESVGSTLDKLEFDVNKWQFGQGLTFEDKAYVHSTNRFKIYNAGDVVIDPRKLPLQIIYRGASNGLTIKNVTNQTEWRYNGSSAANDTIKLDGVYSYKNDVNIFGDTNHQLITLDKGCNEIELSGATDGFLISFDFRFYYL